MYVVRLPTLFATHYPTIIFPYVSKMRLFNLLPGLLEFIVVAIIGILFRNQFLRYCNLTAVSLTECYTVISLE